MIDLRACIAVTLCASLAACGGGGGPRDAGIDAADGDTIDASAPGDADTDAFTPDVGESCAGSVEGAFTCTPLVRQCCGGVWIYYTDGPCLPRDGGVPTPDCSNPTPQPTCPCATEGMTACRMFSTSLRCESGAWVETPNVACCL